MPIDLSNVTGLPAAPRNENFPVVLMGPVNTTVAGGGTNIIRHNSATSDYWITGSIAILSWALYTSSAGPAWSGTLKIEGTTDLVFFPVAVLHVWPLICNYYTIRFNVQIPMPQVKISIINSSPTENLAVNGWLKLQGVI